ncbi:MAG: hypothetical protein FWD81_04400 [Methanomassiliicoccaceae archaeon]|nr:hypothetical protein [Methanomassiliicoccaceae archaeon]
MVFFKSGDEKFEQGNEFIKRKEYDKARSAFEKAVSKGAADAEVAKVMIALLNLRSASVQTYGDAVNILREKKDLEITFGLFTLKCAQLATECDAVHSELVAAAMSQAGGPALKARAEALFAAAMKFQTGIGTNTLIIPEVYTAIKITGIQKANGLMAEGNENMAESVAMEDPKRAAEFLQMALNYRQQLGDTNAEARIRNKITQYAKAAACWVCGREATGETLHFVTMPTEVTAMQQKTKSASPLPSYVGGESIYVCRACYLAISKRADAIAKQYHDAAIREMQAMEARLNARINQVNARIR